MNYFKAEIYRVFHKKSFNIFALAVGLLIGAAMVFIGTGQGGKTTEHFIMGSILIDVATVVVCAIVFSLVYLDDFKGKTLAPTIAAGQSRPGVILVKQATGWLISLGLYVFWGGLFFLLSFLFGGRLSAEQTQMLIISALGSYTKVMGYQVLAGFFVYWTQNAGISLTMVILLSAGFIQMILSLVLSAPQISKIFGDLSPYLFKNAAETLFMGFQTGSFEGRSLVIVVLYLILPTVLTSAVFTKKELNF